MDTLIPEETNTKAVVDNLIQQIEADYGPVYTQKIGEAPVYLSEEGPDLMVSGSHDTPLGNFITDAFRWKTNTDIAIEPGGSIAMPIQQGPAVAADLFRAVGYGFNTDNGLGFRIAKFNITGAALLDGIRYILSTYTNNDEFFLQVSGLNYGYKFAHDTLTLNANLGNNSIDSSTVYSVSTNELVPMMLDILQIPYSNLEIVSGLTEYEVLVEYVNHLGGVISDSTEGRITPVKNNSETLPYKFNLGQNYPNPFNPTTTIQYTINQSQNVRLVVYDLLGREVKTLVNEFQEAGNHKIIFNAGNLASGIYFYSITAGPLHQVKKMILLK